MCPELRVYKMECSCNLATVTASTFIRVIFAKRFQHGEDTIVHLLLQSGIGYGCR